VAHAARGLLLSVYRPWLRRDDLEDCYSQATVELVAQARRGELRYSSRAHLRNMLELRFVSRVRDRRRALRGRSPAQAMLDGALSLGGPGRREVEIADPRADVERSTLLRFDLRSLERAAHALSPDQRLVLACQIGLQMSAGEFCVRFGWSREKHRKVAQRARARLRRLLAEPVSAAPAEDVPGEDGSEDSPVGVVSGGGEPDGGERTGEPGGERIGVPDGGERTGEPEGERIGVPDGGERTGVPEGERIGVPDGASGSGLSCEGAPRKDFRGRCPVSAGGSGEEAGTHL
jgi:DNA-directed RNA polymerase specialized sigma24 family protein